MRRTLAVISHPLTSLAFALGWNYVRHVRGLPTMCSTSRKYVGPVAAVVLWSALTGWLLPHYVRPFLKR